MARSKELEELREETESYRQYLKRPSISGVVKAVSGLYGEEHTRETIKGNLASYTDRKVLDCTLEELTDEILEEVGIE